VITIGIDPHKSSLTAVAVDLAGHELGQIRLPVSKDLGGQLLGWAQAWPDRQWAVEGATGLGRGVAQLLASGTTTIVDPARQASVQLAVLLAAMQRMVFGTGIANIWAWQPQTTHSAAALLAQSYPGRPSP
jgi:hypothetical protein